VNSLSASLIGNGVLMLFLGILFLMYRYQRKRAENEENLRKIEAAKVANLRKILELEREMATASHIDRDKLWKEISEAKDEALSVEKGEKVDDIFGTEKDG